MRINIAYSPKWEEFSHIVNYLKEKGFLVIRSADLVTLTVEGLDNATQLSRKKIASDQCFIAMSFNPELLLNFKTIVMPKIKETGFNPITVDVVPHNESILDRILYEIKNSHFVVVDFTEQNLGAYYEAGYAKGLGLEVIWTVRKEISTLKTV